MTGNVEMTVLDFADWHGGPMAVATVSASSHNIRATELSSYNLGTGLL